jgi:hypothetical protein
MLNGLRHLPDQHAAPDPSACQSDGRDRDGVPEEN